MSNEFDSQYCNVKYIEKDNVVLVTWKKFCRLDDYRKPTMFAAELLKSHKNSNMIADARHGFEDDKADVEWGFKVLLPEMAKSDCKKWAFIVNEVGNIDGELDMWSLEIMKYFKIKKVLTYNEALDFIKKDIIRKG